MGDAMKPFLCFATLILAAFLLWWFCYPEPMRPPVEQFTPAERAYYRARHLYHGIGGNVVDLRTGERTFERDGRVCRL
jgi:hypothetical protein